MNANPFRLISTGLLLLTLIFSACSDDNNNNSSNDSGGEEISTNKTTGFIVVGSTNSGSSLAKYFEELPTGNVDLSDGKDFSVFYPTSIFDHALFMARVDGTSGFSKIVVDENGEIIEEGFIPTIASKSFRIDIRDSKTGVFQDRATPDVISVFNPKTLEVTATIDMSEGFLPNDIDQRYQRFIFRGNDVFASVRGNENGDLFPSFILHQANLSTNSYVGYTEREGDGKGPISTLNDFGQNLTDEEGNLYIQDAGNLTGAGIFARINKIPVGSNEIDDTYAFEPVKVLSPTNTFLPVFNTFNYVGNGKAIAKVNADTPQEAIDIVIGAGGVDNLTNEQVQQIFAILFSAESAYWCELDLNAKTVTPIQDVPALGVFTAGATFRHNGEIYLPVATTAETAYYKYNPSSGKVTKAFTISGANIVGVYNIANNN